MKLYYDLELQSQIWQGSITALQKPVLIYGTAPVWEICLTAGGEVPDLSGIAAWRAAVDGDFNADTVPVCRSLGDKIDTTGLADGTVKVQLFTRTAEFLAALNREKQRNGYFELQALTGEGYAEFIIQIPVILHSSVDPADAGTPDPIEVEQFVRKTELDALVARITALEVGGGGGDTTELEQRIAALESAVMGAEADLAAIIGGDK